MDRMLKILEEDCRLSDKEIAVMLSLDESEVARAREEYEKAGVIMGYKACIDWDKTKDESAVAMIELKVTPQYGEGFDKIAKRIYDYPEVESVYLMSGSFDIMVLIRGRTMKEVAMFVSTKLAPMEAVVGTSTSFVLKKYKENGVIFGREPDDEREVMGL
ncbi:MAG: Lrp/AsnC family transcriptional regulator [Clostridia bacterium]|nr:Lrp/AsnC family transcriptional regulator [Clostridia bacterium]